MLLKFLGSSTRYEAEMAFDILEYLQHTFITQLVLSFLMALVIALFPELAVKPYIDFPRVTRQWMPRPYLVEIRSRLSEGELR